ncbi:MAG: hypothetical protein GXY03_15275 [Solirubrobacterales bacterium]|nr:hypothetical protein [Solirubrobacterales bacterium]
MSYPIDLAFDQWRMGQSRTIGDPDLTDAAEAVLSELRKRLGGAFEIAELVDLYGSGTDWASEIVQRHSSATDAAYAIDAAFARYARQASDFAGGRMQRVGDEA